MILGVHYCWKNCAVHLNRRPLVRARQGCRPFSLFEFAASTVSSSTTALAGKPLQAGNNTPSDTTVTPLQQPPPVVVKKFHSAFDKSRDWRDWFHPAEYENPWDKHSTRFQFPLDHPTADSTTRHLIELLQKFHRFENSTTAQCNAVLTNLLELSIGQPSIAERAVAILENMEILENTHRDMHSTTSSHDALMMVMPSGDVVEKAARALPKPNRITYNTVLRILAKTVSTKEKGPDVAQRIVETMQQKFEKYHQLDMRPVPFHWNCVLLAYMECDDPNRAMHALKLMLDHPTELDVSSFIHLLRMCPSSPDVGSQVAVRMWKEFLEGELKPTVDHNNNEEEEEDGTSVTKKKSMVIANLPDFPSVFYAHFLQAIRPLPLGRLRSTYFDECFSRAIHFGKVNQIILKEFLLQNKSDELFKKHLGPYRRQIYGMTPDTALRRLVSLIPMSWSKHADMKKT